MSANDNVSDKNRISKGRVASWHPTSWKWTRDVGVSSDAGGVVVDVDILVPVMACVC